MPNKKLSVGERVIRYLGGVTRAELDLVRNRAFESGMEVADSGNDEPRVYTADGRAISTGYRQVVSTPRDLSNWSQERAIEAAFRLWNTNPLAKSLTEIVVDYVVGAGITIKAENPEVQKVLDRFLLDPVNNLIGDEGETDSGIEELVRELGLTGELLVLVFVRDGSDKGIPGDGRVRLGTVDPASIHSVITDTKNRRDVLAVRLKSRTGGQDGPVYKIIRVGDSGLLEGRRNLAAYREQIGREDTGANPQEVTIPPIKGKEWLVHESEQHTIRMEEAADDKSEFAAEGECFYYRVNKISTGVRGRPDMLPLIDWLDRFDQLFFDGAEHAALLNMYVWDLMIKGGQESAPEKERNLSIQAAKVAKTRPNSVYAHNENTELKAVTPDLKTQDLQEIVRQLRVLVAGGSRMPEHWLGEGGYTNRATAGEMGQPTYRMLTRRQGKVRSILRQMCRYAIDVAVALKVLPEEVDVLGEDGEKSGQKKLARKAFTVDMPDINPEDTNMAARSFASVAQALLPLVAGNLVPKKIGLELLAAVAALLGVTIDVEAAMEDGDEMSPETVQSLLDLIKSMETPDDEPKEEPAEGE